MLLKNIPEIHALYCTLNTSKKSDLLPVRISFLTNHEHNKIYTQISYQKEQENKVKTNKFMQRKRKSYFEEITENSANTKRMGICKQGDIIFLSKDFKGYKENDKDAIDSAYKFILGEYTAFDIVSILTRTDGYRFYIDLDPLDWHFLCTSLAAMFYLGSAARYRPHDIQEVMKGEMRPLITELVTVTPTQFLYHMVSLITNRECVIPFSSID